MYFVFLLLSGIISGILAGMGMGGGTLLIPILTIFFNLNQKLAQGVNLIAFSIMACITIFIHLKNKLIEVKTAIIFSSIALITSILGAILANSIKSNYLKICYGVLLISVAIYQAVTEIITINKNNLK